MNEPQTHVLVKYAQDWADEFDLHSVWVVSKERWLAWKETVRDFSYPCVVTFGTNGYLQAESSGDILGRCEVKDLTADEAKLLRRLFVNGYVEPPDDAVEFGCPVFSRPWAPMQDFE